MVRADGDGAVRAGLRELLSRGEFTQGYAAFAREVTGGRRDDAAGKDGQLTGRRDVGLGDDYFCHL